VYKIINVSVVEIDLSTSDGFPEKEGAGLALFASGLY
jgi:hypothetical protein